MAPRTFPQKRSEMVGICRGQDLGPDMPSFPCGMPWRLPLCHTPLGANVPSSRAPGLRRLRGGAPSVYGLHLDGLVVYLMLPLCAQCAYAVVGCLLTFLLRVCVARRAPGHFHQKLVREKQQRAPSPTTGGDECGERPFRSLSGLERPFRSLSGLLYQPTSPSPCKADLWHGAARQLRLPLKDILSVSAALTTVTALSGNHPTVSGGDDCLSRKSAQVPSITHVCNAPPHEPGSLYCMRTNARWSS